MTPRNWHRAEIKAAIEMAGTNMSAIARSAGLTPGAVGRAVANRRPMCRVKAIVARAIGRRAHEIWPSLFDERDSPREDSRPKPSTCRRAGHVSRRIQRPVAA